MDITNITKQLEKENVDDIQWSGSIFEWIHHKAPASKGTIGRKIVESIATTNGICVQRLVNKTSDVDTVLDFVPTEVKLSMLWSNNTLVFQQLRDQQYSVACLLALFPSGKAMLWIIPKEILLEHAEVQHTGKKRAGKDTKWLKFDANNIPEWMQEYGGEIETAINYFKTACQ